MRHFVERYRHLMKISALVMRVEMILPVVIPLIRGVRARYIMLRELKYLSC